MRYRTITYAIDGDTGMVWSRVDSEVALPILDFEGMTPENGWEMKWPLEKVAVTSITGSWNALTWTKKIPLAIKNEHRKFWGMKPIKPNPNEHKLIVISIHDAMAECKCGGWHFSMTTTDAESKASIRRRIVATYNQHHPPVKAPAKYPVTVKRRSAFNHPLTNSGCTV